MAERPRDRIRLSGITVTGYHGVFDHERRDGQIFSADVTLHVDTGPAAAEDRLDLTVDYGVLAERVAAVLAGEPAALVETVAERIAALALAFDGVAAVDVTVHKPQAPVPVPVDDVTVEIHRDRATGTAVPVPAVGPEEAVVAPAELIVPEIAPEPGDVAVPAADPGVVGPVPTTPPAASTPDRLDDPPEGEVPVVLALGSNVGASQDTLRQAIAALDAVDGLVVTEVAPLARTAAVGGPEQPDFLNTVALGRTTLSPRALLRACLAVERAFGRVRDERWGPRTLDIDIVMHGVTVAVSDDLELPHPRAHQRAFVLIPWAHVDPAAVLPGLGGGPVAVLAETAPDRDGIRWMALDWWGAEARS